MGRSRFGGAMAMIALGLAWTCGLAGCGTRVITTTGTTLGLKASPGDGQTRPPQVTFGYKRAEASMIPTKGNGATRVPNDPDHANNVDAYSTLSTFYFSTEWFGSTHIASFIGTGFAARDIIGDGTFARSFASATVRSLPASLQNRRVQLDGQLRSLSDAQVRQALDVLGVPVAAGLTPQQTLQAVIGDAQSEAQIARIGDAFNRVR
jgi:hypothetical protein